MYVSYKKITGKVVTVVTARHNVNMFHIRFFRIRVLFLFYVFIIVIERAFYPVCIGSRSKTVPKPPIASMFTIKSMIK